MKLEIVIIQFFADPNIGARTQREHRFTDLKNAELKFNSCLDIDKDNRGLSETEIHIAVLDKTAEIGND